jgi:hypothetical protein
MRHAPRDIKNRRAVGDLQVHTYSKAGSVMQALYCGLIASQMTEKKPISLDIRIAKASWLRPPPKNGFVR